MLAKRLARHGLALSSGTLAAVLSQKAASASVPTSVMTSTIQAVTLVAAGQAGAGVISAQVAALAEGVVKAMLLMKLKTAGAVLLVILGMVALGGGLFTRPTEAAPKEGEKSTNSKADQPKAASSPKAVRSVEQPKPNDLPAKQIVDRMVKAYTDCKSYRDSGIVKTLFVENGGNRTVEKPFTTAFVRPDRFRFEYKETVGDRQMRFIVWSNGKEVQTWWDVKPGIDKPKSLRLALGGAASVSGNSSLNIPQLLLPDKMNWRRLALMEPKRAKDGKLDKVDCFRVEGKYGGNPITLWIDMKTYLVRRIDEQAKFDNFRTEQTTTYDPIIDQKITDKMLEFDPPAPK
jgi:outer membrane lipoprotein-sorting protein